MFSLIVPTYNESSNITALLESVTKVLTGLDFEIIVVDDYSPDKTYEVFSEYRKKDDHIRCLVRKNESGLSSAVIRGFERAKGDILGVMDADLSHDPKILPKLIKAVEDGSQMAIGIRESVEGWGITRKLISKCATMLARLLIGVKISDPMSGYFTLKKSLFEKVKGDLNPIGYKILLEIYARAKPENVAEVPFVFKNRVAGESKLSNKVIKEYLKQLISLRKS